MTKKKNKRTKAKSIEFQAFSKHSSELHEALNDGVITSLAWKLFQYKVFSHSTVEIVTNPMLSAPEKATKLVGAMIKVIKTDRDNLKIILDQCNRFLELGPVVEQMKEEYEKLKDVCPGFKEEIIANYPQKRRSCSKINRKCLCRIIIVTVVLIISLLGVRHVKYSEPNSNFTIYEFLPNLIGSQPQNVNFNREIPKEIDFLDKELPLNVSWPLPSRPEPFVERTDLIKQITKKLFISKIVGLFGPPAFGKSSLAIHIGHEIMNKRRINVSHLDLSEFQLSFNQQIQFRVFPKQMQVHGHCDDFEQVRRRSVNVDNLLKWAASIEHISVLILDNCDSVLNQWHDEFQDFLLELLKYSKENLKIIITSQRKISFVNHFIAVEVTEFSEKESLSLIRVLQPQLSDHIQNEIAELVGNCPLAIKVALVLLQTIDSNMLISDIKTNGIHALSSPSFPKKERFNLIMETACQYLDITTKEAAYFLSFFPGSFDKDVILFSTFEDFRQSINILFERSLLESYTVSPSLEVRYKFHKLIREYFQQKILTEFNSKDKWRFVFQKEFVAYYTSKFSKYFTSSNSISSLSLENQLFLSTEQHNLRYLASIIVKNVEFTSEEKIVVVFAYMQGVMQSNQSGIILNMIIELVEQNNTKFIDVCFSNDTNMCKDLVLHLIHSAEVATDTSYAFIPCNTLKKITLDKWTFITDVFVQNLLDNSQTYCLQNENVIILKYVFFFMFSIFYWSKNFHNYKVLLCASREYDPDDFFFYYFTLPFVVYLLKNYPVYILCFSILFVCYFVNICTGLYLCLFYLNYLWLYYIDTIIRYFLSLDGNGAIWLKRWCYLCINFTSANSDWIFYTVNSTFCAIIIPGIPIVIAVMGSYFISTQYVIYYFHSFLYRLNRNN